MRVGALGRSCLFLALASTACHHAAVPQCASDSECGDGGGKRSDGGGKQTIGSCTVDAQCASGICGLNGACCLAVCTSDPSCGASGCSPTDGTCLYPDAGTACGSVCASAMLTSDSCNGLGGCVAQPPGACPGLLTCADGSSCRTQCLSSTDCVPSASCQVDAGICCPTLSAGQTLFADSVTGTDEGCCGLRPDHPCATLTHVLALIGSTGMSGLTIEARVDGDGGSWQPDGGEQWPVVLGLGVTLSAPGVAFDRPPANPGVAFMVMGLIPGDDGGVTVRGGPVSVGDASSLLQIGFPFNDAGSGTEVAIRDGIGGEVEPNSLSLSLSEVQINGLEIGLQIGPKASVTLGPGRLLIGSPAAGGVLGGRGLVCQGTGVGPRSLGAFVNDYLNGSGADLPDAGVSLHSLEIIGQQIADIDVGDFCFMDLERAPVLGPEGDCTAARGDPIGLRVTGASEVAVGGGLINCMGLYGAQFIGSAAGIQEDTLESTEVLGAGCAGALDVGGGVVALNDCSFSGNRVGLAAMDGPGGTGQLGPVDGEVVCSEPGPAPAGCDLPGGIDLLNLGLSNQIDSIGASFLSWNGGTDVWTCADATLTSCSCSGPVCPSTQPGPLPSQATAVQVAGNMQIGGGIDITEGHGGGTCLAPP